MTLGGPAERREVVGVLGGTFDPVHLGHLHVAEQVRRVFSLRRVLFVPCAVPPHKDPSGITATADRLAMLQIALARREGLELCTIEIDRGGTSYTIETLRRFRAEMRLDPLFIVGMDAILEIPTWREYERILQEFDLVVVDRPGVGPTEALEALPRSAAARWIEVACDDAAGTRVPGTEPGHGGRMFHVAIPPLAVSSRTVRAMAASSRECAALVPPEVDRYIQDQALYRQEDPR